MLKTRMSKSSAKPLFGGSIPPRASNNLRKVKRLSRCFRFIAINQNGEHKAKRTQYGGRCGVERIILLPPLALALCLPLPANPLHWARHHPKATAIIVASAVAGAMVASRHGGPAVRLKRIGCAECSGVGR